MKNYTLQTCEDLISKYVNEYGGECTQISEGCLGLGFLILHNASGKKAILIKEYFINAWSSGHEIKMYNKLPKKYATMIENIYEIN